MAAQAPRPGPVGTLVLIEDDAGDALLVTEYLAESAPGVELSWVRSIAEALTVLGPETACALLDLGLPDSSGFSGLDAVLAACPQAAVIVLTGLVDDGRGLAAVARGAQDYLEKDRVDPQLLARSIRYAVERKQAQLATLAASARAQVLAELDMAKGGFFAEVNQELRTPLTLISAPLADLLAETPNTETLNTHQRELVELAARNCDRLAGLVDAMLDFARLEARQVIPQALSLDLARVTADLATNFAPAVEAAGLRFDVTISPLPGPCHLDPDMWERVALVLLSNAVKYTLAGEIILRLSGTDTEVELVVADTGVGIDEAELPHLFERFHKVHEGGGRTQQGAGIGLAIAFELVKLMGGSIEVSSVVGKGSTFRVHLPLHKDPGALPAPATWAASDSSDTAVREVMSWDTEAPVARGDQPGRARVLVAEDNADMRLYLADVLGERFDVETVPDGEAAWFAMRRSRPDLLLSDVMMPGLDGFALVDRIRRDPDLRTLPIILLSARAGPEAGAEGLAAGADDYIVKPFSSGDLLARVEANLERSREHIRDLAWRNAMLSSLSEGVSIVDTAGAVLDMNPAFAEITGYGREGLPYPPPQPWWPDPHAFPEQRALMEKQLATWLTGGGQYELMITHRDGHSVWIAGAVAVIDDVAGPTLLTVSARDITRERTARARRDAASQLTTELVNQLDLAELQAAAVHGFGAVFGGAPYLFEDPGADAALTFTVSSAGTRHASELAETVRRAIETARRGEAGPDPEQAVPGLLLVAQAPQARYLVWVQFPAPRRVSADERVLAGMLGDMLATAKDRAVRESARSHTEEHLRAALGGQRAVAQAVGILIERHKLTHQGAFEWLREASNRRNTKMRELAERLVDTGEEP